MGLNVITGNVKRKSKRTMKQTVTAPTKKVVQRTSTRKHPLVDYSKLDKDLDVPSPPRKCHKLNLLRKPSKMVIAAHKKHKQMSPLGTSTGVKKTVTTTVAVTPSTSSGITNTAKSTGTVTVSASAEETKAAISALLTLGQDLPQLDDFDVTAENEMLVPINPNVPSTSTPKVTIEGDNTATKPAQTVPVNKRFVTVEYKLKRKRRRTRKFRCVKCDRSFESQRKVNNHFKDTHPPVKCDFCDRSFACPASMLKHRYSHYKTMIECDTCGKGFQFQSQLTEHRRIHQVIGDWVCFKPGCGKRFKRESELDAHLYNHRTTKLKCDQCTYENADPRNMHAHKRKHSEIKSFICKECGAAFRWVQQRRRHIKNNKCPGRQGDQ